ncbi:hypothetical protein QMK33_06340 [Hymenobacter sp. H14-R3]|uniref:hypothetical protein n=1 Tax=Hymenobacter sp. H14-R3 TaxID=3046308 RepID=UPI0024BB117B|nr:hypothetical protein [Hymenobacter sp. H14-R3]MDJ0364764.1 hypothetical protein [Hymenobacter sp. H14-R3]
MKRFLPFAAIGSLLLLAFQCEDRYEGPDIAFGPGAGITYRDAQGRFTHRQDASDWTSDSICNTQEINNLYFPNLNINGPQQPTAVLSNLAYPNPGSVGQLRWRLKLSPAAPCPCQVYASVRSKRYTEVDIYQTDNLAAGDSVVFAPKTYDFDQTYRLYYVVSNAAGLLNKGHGDLLFTK